MHDGLKPERIQKRIQLCISLDFTTLQLLFHVGCHSWFHADREFKTVSLGSRYFMLELKFILVRQADKGPSLRALRHGAFYFYALAGLLTWLRSTCSLPSPQTQQTPPHPSVVPPTRAASPDAAVGGVGRSRLN